LNSKESSAPYIESFRRTIEYREKLEIKPETA
jgi:hypothetical protein